MAQTFHLPKEFVQYLEKLVVLTTNDLKLKDYERGLKAGQLEIIQKIRALYDAQERR